MRFKINEILKEKGLKYKDLYEATGINIMFNQDITLLEAKILANFLECKIDDLIETRQTKITSEQNKDIQSIEKEKVKRFTNLYDRKRGFSNKQLKVLIEVTRFGTIEQLELLRHNHLSAKKMIFLAKMMFNQIPNSVLEIFIKNELSEEELKILANNL